MALHLACRMAIFCRGIAHIAIRYTMLYHSHASTGPPVQPDQHVCLQLHQWEGRPQVVRVRGGNQQAEQGGQCHGWVWVLRARGGKAACVYARVCALCTVAPPSCTTYQPNVATVYNFAYINIRHRRKCCLWFSTALTHCTIHP